MPMNNPMPPQNVEAERCVLGAILINEKTLDKVAPILKVEDFYRGSNRDAYSAMLELRKENKPIDLLTLTTKLDQKGILERCGGVAYVSDLCNSVVTAANAECHAGYIVEMAKLRRIIAVGTDMITEAYNAKENADVVLEKGERGLLSIGQANGGREFITITDALQNAWDEMNKLYESKGGRLGVSSGYQDLDRIISGLRNSEFIIIAARPGVGKTSFALNLTLNAALRSNKAVAYFSLEMDTNPLCQRMLCSESGVSMTPLKNGSVKEEEWSKLIDASDKISQVPIFFSESGKVTVKDMRHLCRRLKVEGKLDMIVVDYIQLMESERDRTNRMGDSRQQEVSDISRGLKQLARELQVPVIGLSQLSRGVENRTVKRPLLSDLRESGSLEQDADIVMFLYREDYYTKDADDKLTEVIVMKNRNGQTGTACLLFDRACSRFSDMPEEELRKRQKRDMAESGAPPIGA